MSFLCRASLASAADSWISRRALSMILSRVMSSCDIVSTCPIIGMFPRLILTGERAAAAQLPSLANAHSTTAGGLRI
eukprot:4650314-Prymnesium_polylepis.1